MPIITGGFNRQPQNWVWGQGANAGRRLDPAGSRLLSPAEFNLLETRVQQVYGGYMGYLNAHARQQKTNRDIASTYEAVQNGTYDPPPMGNLAGADVSSSSRKIPSGGLAKGVGIPSTTLHRDMSGNVTQEIAGGGVSRGLGGEVIPQTAEQLTQQNALDLAIPQAKETNLNQLLQIEQGPANRDVSRITSKQNLEDKSFVANMTPAQRYKESVRGQAQQRIDSKTTEDAAKADRWVKTMNHKEYMANVNNELTRGRMKLANTLQNANRKDQQAWQESMAKIKGEIPNTPESLQRLKEAVDRATMIADHNFENAKTKMELDAAQKVQEDIGAYKTWLDKQIVNPGVFQNTQALNSQRQSYGMSVQGQPQSGTPAMSQSQFVADFTAKRGVAPTAAQIEKARGRYWM
jgi:hypothetical protein